VTITRDALGREVAIAEPGGRTHALRWDRAGRLVERRRDGLALHYGYDEDGRRAFIAYPDGTRTEYRYDRSGLLSTLAHPATGAIAFERDAAGRIVHASGAGLDTRWRDEDVRLERDAAGRIVAIGDTRLFYDAAGQLIAAGDRTFEYDAGGRLVRETSPTGTIAYEYDAAGQLIAAGERTFEYDGSGRRVRAGEQAYEWDAFGRLRAVGDTRVEVDALGHLAAVDGQPLLWDTEDPLSPLVWMDGRAVIGNGMPLATARDGDAEWLAPDFQGTVGGPRDPFGAPLGPTDPTLHLGFRGELEFGGLTWLRDRAYDPASRAFIAPDPLPPVAGTAYAANPYHYAGNDPLNQADPLGRRPVTDQELREIRDRMGQNFFARNADYIIAGALIVGGIVVMATGVGGPIGAAMIGGALLSAGSSAAIQKVTTGNVNYKDVAVAGIIGGLAGGAGAGAGGLISGTSRAAAIGRGALAGGVTSTTAGMAGRGIQGENPFDPKAMGEDLLLGGGTGAIAGGLGARTLPSHADEATRLEQEATAIHELNTHPAALNGRTVAGMTTREGPELYAGGKRDLSPLQRDVVRAHGHEPATPMPSEHAEVTVIKHAQNNALNPRDLGTSRDICPDCKTAIENSGGRVTGPRRAEWPD
jgi:RHS repeat-associated protein